jgi:serine/threonine-protein kinase
MVIADKYRVLRELGRGGMGAVYEAVHTGIGKHVALKFLEGDLEHDGQAKARFLREAQTASLVESPHIVHIFDSGCTSDGTPFLVLELLRGEDLRVRLRREGRLSVEEAVAITEQTLRALLRTHAAGIVHRDLKPENIFLCEQEGATVFVKLLDFGISKVNRPETALDTLTHEGAVLGTAFYMSPEQARGESDLDGRSDIYALGAILYEMLAGQTPHVGNVYHAVLVDICTRDASDVRILAPQVPELVALSAARALNREREARYRDAQAFLDALAPLSQTRVSATDMATVRSSSATSQPTAPPQASQLASGSLDIPQRRLGRLLAGAMLTAIVGAALLIVVVHKQFKSQQAKRAAAVYGISTIGNTGRGAQGIAINGALSAPAGPANLSQAQQPSNATSSPILGPRHRSADAGAGVRRAPPRASAALSDELRLKTTMP